MQSIARTQNPKLITAEEVLEIIGVSRRKLFSMISEGEFPAPLDVYERKRTWLNIDVYEWIDSYRLISS